LKRKTVLGLGLLIIALTVGITLANQWTIMSNIYTSNTTKVSDPQLLDIWIDDSAKAPEEATTGQRFTIRITINNTNPATLNTLVMLNVTSNHAITHLTDVEVWPVEGSSVILGESSDPYTIVYIIQNVCIAPGLNVAVTGLTIQYNTAGDYTIKLAVVQ